MEAKTYLLVGPPGIGKTTAACTCKHPTLIIDVDCKANKMENIRHLVESEDVTIYPIRIPLVTDSFRERALHPDGKIKKQPEGYLYVVDLLNRILENDEEFAKYNTIVLDSLTRLVEHMKRLLIYLRGQGKFGKKSDGDMNWPSWGSYLSNLEELFTEVVQMNKNFICTAHEKLEVEHDDFTDTDTVLGHWPMVDGQFMKKMSGYFDECYFMSMSITKVKGSVFKFRTRGNKFCARTSLRLDEFAPADIKQLWKIHEKGKGGK
ncbi:AAA family ATPase [Candidatus Babeliales bacterium]|nr:AAA family ATPase [Candidatus Babeliales bacterium]